MFLEVMKSFNNNCCKVAELKLLFYLKFKYTKTNINLLSRELSLLEVRQLFRKWQKGQDDQGLRLNLMLNRQIYFETLICWIKKLYQVKSLVLYLKMGLFVAIWFQILPRTNTSNIKFQPNDLFQCWVSKFCSETQLSCWNFDLHKN